MEKNKQTFSEEVKNETCHLEYDNECAFMILHSFFMNNSEFSINGNDKSYILKTQYSFIIRLIHSLFEKIHKNIKFEIRTSNIKTTKNNTKFMLVFNDIDKIDELFFKNKINIKKLTINQSRSFILGAFLSSGSVSFSTNNSNYHFEIRSSNIALLEIIKELLLNFNIVVNIIKFRNAYKLYFKKSEWISDILKIFGTTETLYKFEDFRIQRDFSNSVQRMNNLDISNINKTIIASRNQIIWIQTIKNKYAINQLDDKAKIFCEVREKYPEESLSSISEIIKNEYDMNIPRTSLNHIIKRIETLYIKLNNPIQYQDK